MDMDATVEPANREETTMLKVIRYYIGCRLVVWGADFLIGSISDTTALKLADALNGVADDADKLLEDF